MIFLRSILFNIVMYSSGAALSFWAHCGIHSRAEHSLQTGRRWARVTLWALLHICRIGIDLRGAENLPRANGALVAAQHQSAMDIMVWLTLLPRPAYVLKQELLRIPLFGPALTLANMIAVDRAGGSGSLRKMVEECRAAINDGRQIIIFPEGTRVIGREAAKLQPGIVALAKALKTDIIPASTNSGRRWGRKAFVKRPGPVLLQVYPAISYMLPREAIVAQLAQFYYGETQ